MRNAATTVSKYTLTWIFLGAFINLALLGVFPPYRDFLSFLGIEGFTPTTTFAQSNSMSTGFLSFQTVVAATILGVIGMALLYFSSRFDFVEKSDDPAAKGSWLTIALIFFGLSWLCFGVAEIARAGQADKGSALELLGLLLLLPFGIPLLILSYTFVLICTSLFLAGLVTLLRTIKVYMRRHRLTLAWKDGVRAEGFDPEAVIGALGDRTSSGAEGRKLHKDARQLLMDIEEQVRMLRLVRDRLRQENLSEMEFQQATAEADRVLRGLSRYRSAR